MGSHIFQRLALSVCVMVASSAVGARAADESGTKPAGVGQTSNRSIQQILADFQACGRSLNLSSGSMIFDPATRKEVGPKVIPTLKKMLGFIDELKSSDDPQAGPIAEAEEPQVLMLLSLFDDQSASEQLHKQAKSPDKDEALKAQSSLLMVQWIKSSDNAAAQAKVAEQVEQLAKDNPASERVAQLMMDLSDMRPATPELADRLQDTAAGMNTPLAQAIKQQVATARKLRSMENKPLVLEGVRLDGNNFSTAGWKGKVILVDFWATWCGPCRAELPRVKKAYAQYHQKGLEVLGVSCDNSGDALQQFLQQNKDMPWPELFDANNPGWHPLATQYGITGIPTMFLIDKKGILRTVNARENFEELIPKLLAE